MKITYNNITCIITDRLRINLSKIQNFNLFNRIVPKVKELNKRNGSIQRQD